MFSIAPSRTTLRTLGALLAMPLGLAGCPTGGGPGDDDDSVNVFDPIAIGALVITEIQADPQPNRPEWIELFNTTDGTINLAILHYKTDKAAGTPQGKDWVGINHIGFWVEDLGEIDEQITAAGGEAFLDQEEPENDTLFFEKKYYTPDGIVFDVSKTGWGGAKKD